MSVSRAKSYSIDQLLMTFRDAIDGLATTAERLDISWREPDAYEEWDKAAGGVFDGFVGYSLASAIERPPEAFPLAGYDHRSVHTRD